MTQAGVARAKEALLRRAAAKPWFEGAAMHVAIDNLDGSGPRDYSSAILRDAPLRITRKLNEPSLCTLDLLIKPGGLPSPVRLAHVSVTDVAGAVLFTGSIASEPVRSDEGGCDSSAVYRAKINAVSDEWLLDRLGPGNRTSGLSLGLDAREALQHLLQSIGAEAAGVSVSGAGVLQVLGAIELATAATWSEGAGLAASAGYAAYRVLGGQASVNPAGSVVHALSDADGTLSISDFNVANLRDLANDVLITGEREPAGYVTEIFTGDGTTSEFELNGPAFQPTHRQTLCDDFMGASVDMKQWSLRDPGSHIAVTAAGLTMSGGNGVDGDTTLTALDAVEMGGSLLIELRGVQLGPNSDGMLAGLYEGPAMLAFCFAGFRVRQSTGTTVIVPVIAGAEVGTVFTPGAGHSYTLRLRLHCAEVQRVMQRYSCMVDGVVQTFGSASGVAAPMDVVFELRDEGASSNTLATVLYDSTAVGAVMGSTPATCVFALANSARLFGSVAGVSVTQAGSMFVEGALASGAKATRLIGGVGEGVDCEVSYGSGGAPGKVSFFAGRVPAAGEQITVRYRTARRSVARLADEVSVAAEAASGVPGSSRWLGQVLQPPARSSADCQTAAQAVLAFATSRTAALAGTYRCVNPVQDIWPGDLLSVTAGGVTTSLLVRAVKIEDAGAAKRYAVAFANDWGTQLEDGLGMRLSETIPSSVALPARANETSLASLGQLQVISVSATTLLLDAGIDPPSGGGFEVRRREEGFRAGSDGDLVLRSPVRTFSLPRAAQIERFYVRMYDASVPTLYSRFASAVLLNVPAI